MRKFAILLGLIVSFMVLMSCANQPTSSEMSATTVLDNKGDLKGELIKDNEAIK